MANTKKRNDRKAKKLVLSTLREALVKKIDFILARTFISGHAFEIVARKIEKGSIKVVYKPELGHIANYNFNDNRIEIPYKLKPHIGHKALILHEAVHAIMDIRRSTFAMEEGEAVGYVVQALYLELNGGSIAKTHVRWESDALSYLSWFTIFGQSAKIAKLIKNNKEVTLADTNLLKTAIRNANIYRANAGKKLSLDGV